MKTAPIPANEMQRLHALHRLDPLDTEPEPAFDDLTMLAAEICAAPIALVSLVDAERQWFKSRCGLQASETSRDVSMCAHASNEQDGRSARRTGCAARRTFRRQPAGGRRTAHPLLRRCDAVIAGKTAAGRVAAAYIAGAGATGRSADASAVARARARTARNLARAVRARNRCRRGSTSHWKRAANNWPSRPASTR
jgi:hypothetical protein